MSADRRVGWLLGATLLAWLLFFAFQAGAGPRDGWVPAHLEDPGWSRALGPVMAGSVVPMLVPGPEVASLGFACLLLLAPLLTVVLIGACLRHPALHRSPVRWALAAAGAVLALAALWNHSYLSNDLHLYRSFGEMQQAGLGNPYSTPPVAVLPGAVIHNVPWTAYPAAYGPGALGLFDTATSIVDGLQNQLWVLKALLALPLLLALLTYWLVPLPAAARWRATAFLALSPVLVLEVLQNGHLDGWIGWLLLLTVLVLERNGGARPILGGLLLGLACAFKPSMVVVGLPMLWFVASSEESLLRRRRLGALWFVVAAGGVLVVSYLSLWQGLSTFDGLRIEAQKLLQSPFAVAAWLGVPAAVLRLLALAGNVLAMVVGVTLLRRGRSLATAVVATLVVQVLLGRTFLQPWYLVPILLLLPLSIPEWRLEDMRLWLLASVAAVFGGYGPFFLVGRASIPAQAAAVAIMLLPPLAYFWWRWRRVAVAES